MSDQDLANLDTPITGEIPDVEGVATPDGGSGASTEEQILSDSDLTDIPDAGTTHDIPEDPIATLGESGQAEPV